MEYLNDHLTGLIGLIGALGVLTSSLIELFKPKLRKRFNEKVMCTWSKSVVELISSFADLDKATTLAPQDFLNLRKDLNELFLTSPNTYQNELLEAIRSEKSSSIYQDVAYLSNNTTHNKLAVEVVDAARRIRHHLKIINKLEARLILQSWKLELIKWSAGINFVLVSSLAITAHIPTKSIIFFVIFGTVLSPLSRDVYKTIQQLRVLK